MNLAASPLRPQYLYQKKPQKKVAIICNPRKDNFCENELEDANIQLMIIPKYG